MGSQMRLTLQEYATGGKNFCTEEHNRTTASSPRFFSVVAAFKKPTKLETHFTAGFAFNLF